MTITIRLIIFVLLTACAGACSFVPSLDKVMPDNRSEYKESEPMPDLEVPPDLTAGATTEAMTIPGEGASLSRYQQQRQGGRQSVGSSGPFDSSTKGSGTVGEQAIAVNGSESDIWPGLEAFFQDRGYEFEISDAGLGVMETSWSDPIIDDGQTYRDKYKLFTEPGEEAGVTVLFIDNERQRRSGEVDTDGWIDADSNPRAERFLAAELNKHFNGSRTSRVATTSQSARGSAESISARALAQLESAGDDKIVLSLPEEFTRAWRSTETVLERAGFSIIDRDQGKGMYYINYFDRSAGEKKGWLSKLAFWKDDESESVPYVLSLTGSGSKTEVIVLNERGDWQSNRDADRILRIIRNEYNRL